MPECQRAKGKKIQDKFGEIIWGLLDLVYGFGLYSRNTERSLIF